MTDQTNTAESSGSEAEATQQAPDPRKAAEEAIKAYQQENTQDATEPEATKTETKTEDKTADTEGKSDKPEPKLAVIMRAKQQAQAMRDQAEREAQEKLRHAEARIREAEEKAREAERARAAFDKLKTSPIDGLRELGMDPREFFRRALETPEKVAPEHQLKHELEQIKKQQEEDRRRYQEFIERQEQEKRQAAVQSTQRAFLNVAFDEEKFPVLRELYGSTPRQLINEAESVAEAYNAKTGDWPTHEEIAEYLEQLAREKIEAAHARLAKKGSQKQDSPGKEAPQAEKGKKATITQKQASTKATAPKPFHEMTRDEQREEAARQAKIAMEQLTGAAS